MIISNILIRKIKPIFDWLKIIPAIVLGLSIIFAINCSKKSPSNSSNNTKKTYYVAFISNGGSGVDTIKVEEGSKIKKPSDPTRSQFSFDGWYTDQSFKNLFDFTTVINDNITLYAKWTPVPGVISYNISFNSTGGSEIAPQPVISGDTAIRPVNPTRSGYSFAGWYTNDQFTIIYNFNTPITANITIYAKWNKIYTVTFSTEGGSNIAPQNIVDGDTVVRPTNNPTRSGYSFAGWYTNDQFTIIYNFNTPITANITIYAKWNKLYTVNFNTSGGSSIKSQNIVDGDTVVRPTTNPTRQGFSFVEWYADAQFTTIYKFSTPITTDITIYAKWIQVYSPSDYQNILGKGMDVDWVKTNPGMNAYSSKSTSDFVTAGVKHVRLRISESAPNTNSLLLQTLDTVLSDCFKYDMIPVVAYQADPLNARLNIDSFVNWWAFIAERYKDIPYTMAFDLNIEPSEEINHNPDILNQAYEKAVTAIRQYSPKRIIMIAPIYRASPYYLSKLTIPTQANGYLMAQWHFYASGPSPVPGRKEDVNQTNPVVTDLTFTYQYWAPGSPGTIYERWLVQTAIDTALAWQSQTGVPTYIGAWMAGNYNDGDNYSIDDQVKFATFMTQSIDKAKVPFALNADTKFYNVGYQKPPQGWSDIMLPVFKAVFN